MFCDDCAYYELLGLMKIVETVNWKFCVHESSLVLNLSLS